MAIGLGVVLIVVGLVLSLDVVHVNMSLINADALGGILIAAGILSIVLSLVVNQQRSRRTTVVQNDQPAADKRPLR